jgi:hypothetical protein
VSRRPGSATRAAEGEHARGVLLALCSAALSVSAHAAAGGARSDIALTALLTTLFAWGGASLARRGGLLTLIGVLGATQLGQHVLLTEIATTHAHAAAPPPVDGWAMFITHAVATVVTAALLLRTGTALRWVYAAWAWLTARLRTLVAGPVPAAAGPRPMPTPARPGQLLEILLRRVLARRGPPLGS